MTQEEWYIVLYVLIIIPTMVIVVMEKRQPMKTVAWLLVLAFVPIVGLVFYFFFGQNIRKERYIARHSLDKLMRKSMIESGGHHPLQLPERNQKLIQLFASQDLALPSNNNVVDIYTSAKKLFDDMLKEIDEAEKEHVDTLVTFSDEINDLKNYRESGVCGILRNLLVWYRSGDHKKNLLFQTGGRTPLVSNPQHRRLDDYTSIHRLRGVAKNHMIDVDGSTAFLSSRLSEEIERELLRLTAIPAGVGIDVPQM